MIKKVETVGMAYFEVSRAWRVCASVTVNGADSHQIQHKQRVSARHHVVTFVVYIATISM